MRGEGGKKGARRWLVGDGELLERPLERIWSEERSEHEEARVSERWVLPETAGDAWDELRSKKEEGRGGKGGPS